MKHYTLQTANAPDDTNEEIPLGARWLGFMGDGDYSLWEIQDGYFWDGQVWQSNSLLKLLEEERAMPRYNNSNGTAHA